MWVSTYRCNKAVAAAPSGFAVTFSTTANPYVGDGLWINRGLDWTKFATDGAKAYCTIQPPMTGYDDSYGYRANFGTNQHAEGVVYLAGGYSPGASHEIELLLRCTDSAHNISYYEFNWSWAGDYAEIVWLVGTVGTFVSLSLSTSNPVAPQDGDIFSAEAIETPGVSVQLTSYYKRGAAARVILAQVTLPIADAHYIAPTAADGCGCAFFTRTGATATSYGLKSFACSSL